MRYDIQWRNAEVLELLEAVDQARALAAAQHQQEVEALTNANKVLRGMADASEREVNRLRAMIANPGTGK